MPTDTELVERIAALDRGGLLALWEQVQAGDTPGWPSGRALEFLILRAFQLEGAEVRWPYTVTLAGEIVEQIDGVIYAEGLGCVAEAKDSETNINFVPIAKLRNQLARRPAATVGLMFSRLDFTEPARVLARFLAPQTVLLWTGADLGYALREGKMVEGLRLKYRHALEEGSPHYPLPRGYP
jgi:hypothetical protein